MREVARVVRWRFLEARWALLAAAMAVLGLAMTWHLPAQAGWADVSNAAVTKAYAIFLAAALAACVMASRARACWVLGPAGRRPGLRQVAETVATATVCGWFALLSVQLTAWARFLAVAAWEPFTPLIFAVGCAAMLLWCAVGAALGWFLPRWASLPATMAVVFAGLILPAAQPDTWLALATPVDDGSFIPGVEEPRAIVLLLQLVAFVAVASVVQLGVARHRPSTGARKWLWFGMAVVAVAVVLGFAALGPDRRTHPSGTAPLPAMSTTPGGAET